MRGIDETSGSLFSCVDLAQRIRARHPLRKIRQVVNDALTSLDAEFEALYTESALNNSFSRRQHRFREGDPL